MGVSDLGFTVEGLPLRAWDLGFTAGSWARSLNPETRHSASRATGSVLGAEIGRGIVFVLIMKILLVLVLVTVIVIIAMKE